MTVIDDDRVVEGREHGRQTGDRQGDPHRMRLHRHEADVDRDVVLERVRADGGLATIPELRQDPLQASGRDHRGKIVWGVEGKESGREVCQHVLTDGHWQANA